MPNVKWIADEVLYQARIHPACPVPLLTPTQIRDMHFQLQNVCQTAVDAYSEHSKFPENWLFRWRWSKGKKQERGAKKVKGVDSDPEVEDLKSSGKDFLALVSPTRLDPRHAKSPDHWLMKAGWQTRHYRIHRSRRPDHGCSDRIAKDA